MPRHRAQTTELEKSCQFFVGSNDESLSVVAVRINNPDRSPVESIAETQPELQLAVTLLDSRQQPE